MQSIVVKTPGVNNKAIYEVTKRLNTKAEVVLTLVKEDGTLDKDSTVTLKVTSGLASDIPLRTRYTLTSQNVSTYKLFQASVKSKVSAKDKPVLAKSTPVEIPDNATPAKPVSTKCVATLGSTTTQNAKTKSTTKAKVAVKAKPVAKTKPAVAKPVAKTKPAVKAKAKAPTKAKKVRETVPAE